MTFASSLHLVKKNTYVNLTNLKDIIICLFFLKFPRFIIGLILFLPSKLDLWNWTRPWRLNKFGVLGIVDQPCIIKKHSSFKLLRHNYRSRVTSTHAHSCWSLRVAHETPSHNFPFTAFQAHHKLLQHKWRVETVEVLKATKDGVGVQILYYCNANAGFLTWRE